MPNGLSDHDAMQIKIKIKKRQCFRHRILEIEHLHPKTNIFSKTI